MRDKIKVRRTWKIDPVERIHSRVRKPKRWDIPASEEIEEQLQEMLEDELEDFLILESVLRGSTDSTDEYY